MCKQVITNHRSTTAIGTVSITDFAYGFAYGFAFGSAFGFACGFACGSVCEILT